MSRRTLLAVSIALIAALTLSSVAYAITINVDGIKESVWDTGSGGQAPGGQPDSDELAIDNTKDIREVKWTNDQTYMYFLIEAWDTVSFDGDPQPAIYICLDTDGNTGTGGTYANCNGMTGIERTIRIRLSDVNTAPLMVRTTNGPPTGPLISNIANAVYATVYTEIRISLADLGINSSSLCNQSIQGAIYFDGGTTNPDDNTPNSNTITIGCGGPTAVTLNSLQAQPTTSPVVPVALIGVSAAALIGVVLLIRRRKTA